MLWKPRPRTEIPKTDREHYRLFSFAYNSPINWKLHVPWASEDDDDEEDSSEESDSMERDPFHEPISGSC